MAQRLAKTFIGGCSEYCGKLSINSSIEGDKRRSEAFHTVRDFVEHDKGVTERFGKLIRYDAGLEGNIDDPEGHSNFSFEIIGTFDTATVNVSLEKTKYNGWYITSWKYVGE